jgi:hypothetical protein
MRYARPKLNVIGANTKLLISVGGNKRDSTSAITRSPESLDRGVVGGESNGSADLIVDGLHVCGCVDAGWAPEPSP